MRLVDLNLLLYAVNEDAPLHVEARRWWEQRLSGDEQVGLSWSVILGFLRLTTRPVILPVPLTVGQAQALVDEWLEQPPCLIVQAGDRHWAILKDLLTDAGTAGSLVTDAHLAALAIEHGATLCSTDNDFKRFAKLRHENPLA